LAVTERGTQLQNFTEADVELSLRLLVLSGGSVKKTVEALAEEGVLIEHDKLRYFRDVAFPSRYNELRRELSNDIGEELAGRALERAMALDDAEGVYVEKAVDKIDEVSPDRLAAAALSLAKAKGENIEKAQLLRNRPTEIRETRDTAEILDLLKREGVLITDPRLEADPNVAAILNGKATEKKKVASEVEIVQSAAAPDKPQPRRKRKPEKPALPDEL
jgi:hypothetical protein